MKPSSFRIGAALLAALMLTTLAPGVPLAQPKPTYAKIEDLERLEKKIDEQKALVARLVKLQHQYLQSLLALLALTGDAGSVLDPGKLDEPKEPRPAKPTTVVAKKPDNNKIEATRPEPAKIETKPAKPDKPTFGTIVGKVKGGGGEAVVYLEYAGAAPRGGVASMKQQGKQFVPRVLVVERGTKVDFPNADTVFHNVFSVTPDNSFDLGSYRQGESKSITLGKTGVVTVYCNMHPQMVGHVLVVPGGLYARVGSDGFFKLANVPAGKHRIVAWAPNAKPTGAAVEVADSEAATVELEVVRRGQTQHLNKDGLPYGSYKE
jgi:plastocyanin